MSSRAVRIVDLLSSAFPLELRDFASSWVASRGEGPFAVLVVTILSQNSTDVGALKAYENLRKEIGINPEKIASSPRAEVERCIRVAGLYRNKARGLKLLSRRILGRNLGYLEGLADIPFEEARERLMELPQVGPKTADVFLAVTREAPVLPVDTHVTRVSRRLSLAPKSGGYDSIRESLEEQIPADIRHEAHMLFITLGRKICKARTPLCYECPVSTLCPYPNKTKKPS